MIATPVRRTLAGLPEAAGLLIAFLGVSPPGSARAAAQEPRRTENVILVVADGLRWQEVFGGADSSLMNRERGGVTDTAALRRDFWRATAEDRRRALLPFLWTVVARDGQLFGNRWVGSAARVTNGLKFSYPGYNEMLAGFADSRIDRNDAGPNPNLTVFEWLETLPAFRDRTAALASWDTFADIFNRDRSRAFVRAGWEPPTAVPTDPGQVVLARLYRTTTRLWDNNLYDAFLQAAVLEVLASRAPRVLFIGYGETDEWAHAGRYDQLLRSAHQTDAFIAEVWASVQAMPAYRDRTTLVITTDHGRGSGPTAWKNHGRDVAGAEDIWIAVLGPDTPPLGERAGVPPVTQSQIAATVAALLGEDFGAAVPAAAAPITDVLGSRR